MTRLDVCAFYWLYLLVTINNIISTTKSRDYILYNICMIYVEYSVLTLIVIRNINLFMNYDHSSIL